MIGRVKLLEQDRHEGRLESQTELDRLRNSLRQLQTEGKIGDFDQHDSCALNPAHQVDVS